MQDKQVTAKKFNFSTVKGISESQLSQHYKLYEGYVHQINMIWEDLSIPGEFENPNTTYGPLRSLMLGQSYSLDGVKLHDMYFENMTGMNTEPYGEILEMIISKYGSYENFMERFQNTGLSMRGWVVLTMEPEDGSIHIIGQDLHDKGPIWKSHPLLVLDVYEHAYMIDFGINRKKYIEVFFQNIDWSVVNERLEQYKKHMK